ncbi:3-hydroxyacyl-ACP dehydratase [Tamlana agarivorans]|uniref:3-hydroxyacyl-ACP dehydratase n=1 Tax=Pseudotamlana agarivorans TaxID=481183 RepID=A0ACC5UAD3_9FLAO|nr:3-hydroxyacyl-ACP dehydratase [Tamlana agarivorans]MBU2951272.1 3-hydroxyacyl-ACP dehydratase [Tamlana agarivorans]
MQLKDFYSVKDLLVNGTAIVAQITLNKDHEIFKGHFPGNPVTPGVCMMQIIKELTEEVVGKRLFMNASSNIKFMAIINPDKTPDLEIQLNLTETETGYKVKNTTRFEDTVALKLTSNFTVQ